MFRTGFPSRSVARGTLLVLSAASALALTGCASTGSGGGEALDPDDSPLSAWWSEISADAFNEEDFDAQQKKVEEAVATCMADEGFDYTPQDNSGTIVVGPEEFDEKKYAAEQGYGVFNYITEEEPAEGEDEWVDANAEYYESMSETERAAYEQALNGDMSTMEPDENGEFPELDPSQMGCYGKAQEEVMGAQNDLWESEELTAFNEEMERLNESTNNDPRLTALNAKWAECMADAGFADFANPQEPSEWFMEKQGEFWEDMDPESTEDPTTTPEWKALATQEIDTAVADYDCREKIDYATTQLEVQFDLEKKWMDEHADQLKRVAELYREAGL